MAPHSFGGASSHGLSQRAKSSRYCHTPASSSTHRGSLDAVVSSLLDDHELQGPEFDRVIADSILREAQARADARGSASQQQQRKALATHSLIGRPASTNKQFLASVIRNTDEHNRQVVRDQLEDARRASWHRDAYQSHNRHTEPSEDDLQSTQLSPSRCILDSSSGRGRDGRRRETTLRPRRGVEGDKEPGHSRSRDKDGVNFRRQINFSHGRDESHRPKEYYSRKEKGHGRFKSFSAEIGIPSKMDKYFAAGYDPVLDVSVEHSTDPCTGLISDGGWDHMLDSVQRDHEEERSRRRRRYGERENGKHRSSRSRSKRKHRCEGKSRSHSDEEVRSGRRSNKSRGPENRSASSLEEDVRRENHNRRTNAELMGDGLFEKRGTVRAWDLGKEHI